MINRILSQLRDGGTNPRLELIGVVMTMFDGRTRLSQQVVGEVRQHFGDKVFGTVIPRTTRLAEAPSFGKPAIVYDPNSRGAKSYMEAAKEFLNRFEVESPMKPAPASGQGLKAASPHENESNNKETVTKILEPELTSDAPGEDPFREQGGNLS